MKDLTELRDNFDNILSLRSELFTRIYKFMESKDATAIMLSLDDLDLLFFNIMETSNNYYRSYYSGDDISYFESLRSLIVNRSSLKDEDVSLMYRYVQNRKSLEDMFSCSSNGELVIDKNVMNSILNIVSRKTISVGHTIKLFERLVRKSYVLSKKYEC